MSSDYDLDGIERMERSNRQREVAEVRRYQHDLDQAMYQVELSRGYFRTINTTPIPVLPWDGVRNSQIQPIT